MTNSKDPYHLRQGGAKVEAKDTRLSATVLDHQQATVLAAVLDHHSCLPSGGCLRLDIVVIVRRIPKSSSLREHARKSDKRH